MDRRSRTWVAVVANVVSLLLLGLAPAAARAATILVPSSPGNFTRVGQQTATPGPGMLTLTDTSSADRILFYANDADADVGHAVDVVATFQVLLSIPNNADAGVNIVINDGVESAVILGTVYLDLDANIETPRERALALYSGGDFNNPNNWPAFTPVDWMNPTSVRLRRSAAGDAELIEVNGAAPLNPVFLPKAALGPKTRAGGTVEFGAGSAVEPEVTVVFTEFYSETVVPEPATATLFALGIGGLLVASRGRIFRWMRKGGQKVRTIEAA